jgi:hypothetical protein
MTSNSIWRSTRRKFKFAWLIPVASLLLGFGPGGSQQAHGYAILEPFFEPLGIASNDGTQVDLKFGGGTLAERKQSVVYQVVVFQPDTGAVAYVEREDGPKLGTYGPWITAHAVTDSPAFEEGPVVVYARGTVMEGKKVIRSWDWISHVYLIEMD